MPSKKKQNRLLEKIDINLKNYTPLRSQNSSPNLNHHSSKERSISTKPREDHSPYSGGIEPYYQKKSDKSKSRASSGSNFRAVNIQIDNQNQQMFEVYSGVSQIS